MHKLCLFFTVNVTASFTRATYNYTKLYVEITYVFDTCKVEISYNKCTIIFFMNNNYMLLIPQGSTLAVFRYPEHPRFSDGIPDSPAQ